MARGKKNRKRNVTWYNPPYCVATTTNIGRRFLNLIDKHFPKGHKLHKIINRNTVKIGYSCSMNIENIIKNHNNRLLSKSEGAKEEKKCNCRDKSACPLQQNCQQQDVVYQATITNPPKKETKKYIGSTTHFKTRYTGHKSSFKIERNKTATSLSDYIWKNNLNNENIKWEILRKSSSYVAGQKHCLLCSSEKVEILHASKDPHLLNKRSELVQQCRHTLKFRLSNYVAPDVDSDRTSTPPPPDDCTLST